MNWEAIGAVGEVVGAIAVVLTLGYLAVQIRQNSKLVRMSAMQNIIVGSVEHARRITDDPELAALIDRATDSAEELTNVDRIRLNNHAVTLYHHLDGAYQMYQSGMLDEEVWSKFAYEIPIWMNIWWVRDWFEREKPRLTPSFQVYIENRIQETSNPEVMPGFGRPINAVDPRAATGK